MVDAAGADSQLESGVQWCRANVMVASPRSWLPWAESGQGSSDVYKIRLCAPAFAKQIIVAADECGCYRSDRHKNYKTNDLPLSCIQAVSGQVFGLLKEKLCTALSKIYRISPQRVSMREVFVVKYDAEGQDAFRGLDMHEDGSAYSFNALLNDPSEFTGGGTLFEESGLTLRPQQGEVLIHRGKLRHAGVQITAGRRYVLVGFIRLWGEQGASDEQEQHLGVARAPSRCTPAAWP